MLGVTFCAAVLGIDAELIVAEVDVKEGLPSFTLIGVSSSETREAKERVRIALENSGFRMPVKRITVNLSPADIRKEGTSFDLAIAIAILAAFRFIPEESAKNCIFMGELCLDGKVNPVPGVLPAACLAKEQGFLRCFVPKENAKEAALARGLEVYGVNDLNDVVQVLKGNGTVQPYERKTVAEEDSARYEVDFADVQGQTMAKRAIEIAAAGRHNMLMIGPPGTGKSMLAKRIPTILPALTFEESLEISKIYSVAGLLFGKDALLTKPPFQAPHHTITQPALAGGGKRATPGVISLAHKGVLFLDEFPEFRRDTVEVLREPLEERTITVSRYDASYVYPAGGMLVAAMNPCHCGFYPDRSRCSCSLSQIRHYWSKLSRPLLERFDLCTEVLPVKYDELNATVSRESSQSIRARVEMARQLQRERYGKLSADCNSELSVNEVKKYCVPTEAARKLLEQAFATYAFSARCYHRLLKTSRTIADLCGSERIEESHVTEALMYRLPDREYRGE